MGRDRNAPPVFMPESIPESVRSALEVVLEFRSVGAVEVYDAIREALAREASDEQDTRRR